MGHISCTQYLSALTTFPALNTFPCILNAQCSAFISCTYSTILPLSALFTLAWKRVYKHDLIQTFQDTF